MITAKITAKFLTGRAATIAASIILAGGLGYFLAQLRQRGPATASADILRVVPAAAPAETAAPATRPSVAQLKPATAPSATAVIAPATQPAPVAVDLPPDQLFKAVSPSVLTVKIICAGISQEKLGTGFLVSTDGLVVTNFHVIGNATSGLIQTSDGSRTFAIKGVVGVDRIGDLALLKTDASGLAPLTLTADEPPPIGARVYAIGNPEGFSNTLSEGLISGVRSEGFGLSALQTTVPISHGSSGGPLLTASGQVAGVMRLSFADGQNLNFAVPAQRVRQLISRAGKLVALADAAAPTALEIQLTLDNAWQSILDRQYLNALSALANIPVQKKNSWYWFVFGSLLERQHEYQPAISDFRFALSLKPQYPAAIELHLGQCLMALGDYDSAVNALRDCVKADPSNRQAWRDAVLCFRSLGQIQRAISVAQRAMKTLPSDPAWHLLLGGCYINEKDYTQATREFDQYTRLAPADAVGWYQAGYASILNHNPVTAKTDWQRTMKLDPIGPVGNAARVSLLRLEATEPFAQTDLGDR